MKGVEARVGDLSVAVSTRRAASSGMSSVRPRPAAVRKDSVAHPTAALKSSKVSIVWAYVCA